MQNKELSSFVYPQVEQAGIATKILARGMSAIFRGASGLRNFAYDREWLAGRKLPGRVISVGNIAVGGTGKTPTVMALIGYLLKAGKKPAVLTRGYGSGLGKGDWVLLRSGECAGGNCNPAQLPDEARLESAAFPDVPVIAGRARFSAATEFLAQCGQEDMPTHWILDDGFQHRSIERDLDVVLIDVANPFGNFSVLPFGMLREPASSLARADHILLTGAGDTSTGLEKYLEEFAPGIPVSRAQHASVPLARDILNTVAFDVSKHAPVLMVAGIARPERLRRDLENEGVQVGNELVPGDHAPVHADDLAKLTKGTRALVVTAKDYWRNPAVFLTQKIPVFIKNVEIHLPESLLTKTL